MRISGRSSALVGALSAVALWTVVGGRTHAADVRANDHDFSGVWNFSTLTPLERPARFAQKRVLTADEAREFERELLQAGDQIFGDGPAVDELWLERGKLAVVNGQYVTSLVSDPADGRIPALTPAARARLQARAQAMFLSRGPEDRLLSERCLRSGSGPPMLPSADANIIQIVQSDHHVAILLEKFHEARVVALHGAPHLNGAHRQWRGDSRGWWEGQTLVVDTTNFTTNIGLTGRFDDNLHLVERFHEDGTRRLALRGDGRRSIRVCAALDGVGADEADQRTLVRVRLPRGQLRAAEHPARRA